MSLGFCPETYRLLWVFLPDDAGAGTCQKEGNPGDCAADGHRHPPGGFRRYLVCGDRQPDSLFPHQFRKVFHARNHAEGGGDAAGLPFCEMQSLVSGQSQICDGDTGQYRDCGWQSSGDQQKEPDSLCTGSDGLHRRAVRWMRFLRWK